MRKSLGPLLLALALAQAHAREPLSTPLWPDLKVSATPEAITDRSKDPNQKDRAIEGVTVPELTISWPEKADPSAPAAVICPGGGYRKVVIDKEGHAIAKWLNQMGFVAAVLKYRLPVKGEVLEVPLPTQDGLRAVRLLRSNAAKWGIDPKCIGIIGSSAGGHLASTVATHYSSIAIPSNDPIDQTSARPDFQMLLYPVIALDEPAITHAGSRDTLLGENAPVDRLRFFSNDLQVSAQTPPAFIVHAEDDKGVPLANSERYRDALKAVGVPVELLILKTGGHGFGLGSKGGEPASWPPIGSAWLKATARLSP